MIFYKMGQTSFECGKCGKKFVMNSYESFIMKEALLDMWYFIHWIKVHKENPYVRKFSVIKLFVRFAWAVILQVIVLVLKLVLLPFAWLFEKL